VGMLNMIWVLLDFDDCYRNRCCSRDLTTLMFNQLIILSVHEDIMRYVFEASSLNILLVVSQKPEF